MTISTEVPATRVENMILHMEQHPAGAVYSEAIVRDYTKRHGVTLTPEQERRLVAAERSKIA